MCCMACISTMFEGMSLHVLIPLPHVDMMVPRACILNRLKAHLLLSQWHAQTSPFPPQLLAVIIKGQ